MWITDWTTRAACRGMDHEMFVRGEAQHRVKLVCRSCPVRIECLSDALDNGIEFGVWGGMTERERRSLLRRRPEVTSWRELLERARDAYELPVEVSAKDSAEFVACFKAEFNRLVMFLLRQGVPYHDATEAAQAAFTEAFRQWQQIRSPRAWLRRVAVRCIKHIPEDPVQDMSVADQPLLPDSIEISEQTRHVLDMLWHLPPQQRVVMAWTIDGFSPTEIAAEIDSNAAAVRQNLRRARETLKRVIRQEREEER